MITFLFPGFLWALGFLAIPVFIHLFQFRRFKKVYFSNTDFLKHIQTVSRKSREIKKWLILLTRCLSIIFLVLAFAQPIISNDTSGKASESSAVSIYIDNSYSMNLNGKTGPLVQQAMDRAKELVWKYRETDKFQLLTNDFEGKHQRLMNRDEFLRELEEIKTTAVTRQVCDIMARQKQALSAAPKSKHVAYVFSDFQKTFTNTCKPPIDSSCPTIWVPMEAQEVKNIAIDTCWFEFPYFRKEAINTLHVVIANYGDERVENGSVNLRLNGKPITVGNFTVEAGAKTDTKISFTCRENGWQSGVLSVTDNPVNFDDQLYFSFEVLQTTDIYLMEPGNTAKEIQNVYGTDSFFKLYVSEAGQVNFQTLRNCGLIILNGVDQISSGLSEALKKHLDAGGDLMLYPPTTIKPASDFMNLAATLGIRCSEDFQNYQGTCEKLNTRSLLFKDAFEKPVDEIKLPEIKKYIYLIGASRGYETLLAMRGGAPFLATTSFGKGRIYFCASPLLKEFSSFGNHALFVPWMLKAGLLASDPMPLFFRAGNNQYISLNKELPPAEGGFKLQGGGSEFIPQLMNRGEKSVLYISDALQKPGNYTLKTGSPFQPVLSFNPSAAESVMSFSSIAELENIAGKTITVTEENKVTSSSALKDGSTRLWKICLWLTFLFVLLEVALIKWIKI